MVVHTNLETFVGFVTDIFWLSKVQCFSPPRRLDGDGGGGEGLLAVVLHVVCYLKLARRFVSLGQGQDLHGQSTMPGPFGQGDMSPGTP